MTFGCASNWEKFEYHNSSFDFTLENRNKHLILKKKERIKTYADVFVQQDKFYNINTQLSAQRKFLHQASVQEEALNTKLQLHHESS